MKETPEATPEEEERKDGLVVTGAAPHTLSPASASSTWKQTLAGVLGNMLEWYDFAVFGYFSDIIGQVFLPPGDPSAQITESFLIFGGAFWMRPIGGLLLGYIGDRYGRRKALVISIFLMAFPTFAMGCLPSYENIGGLATVLLIVVRLLQGLSVGGQLMSSLVFTLENHEPRHWGYYGAFVMATANCGSLLGGIVGSILRSSLTKEQLLAWGWRIPFLGGIVVSASGFYLKGHGGNDEVPTASGDSILHSMLSPQHRRSLLAAMMVPMLWSAGFYLTFVWMPIFMEDFVAPPVPGSFIINCISLAISNVLLFSLAGSLSDRYGRQRIMTIGGLLVLVLSPIVVRLVALSRPGLAWFAQTCLGLSVALWGAPLCAWLVESFPPSIRLTSVAMTYNIAHALAGGSAPAAATYLAENIGPGAPGWILSVLAVISLIGLRFVAPSRPKADYNTKVVQDEADVSSDEQSEDFELI